MRTVVLDTNVLLADPGVIFEFPDAEIILPETVLGELDKLKTSRVDPDLRFRGREVSRVLFELSEQGSLVEGVSVPDGGTLRVVPFDAEAELPESFSARNADDRILAVALQVCSSGCDGLTVITNDLNMLLKAQALGLAVERHGDGTEGSFGKRYIIRPFQRYKVPLTILAVALAVFAAIVFLVTRVTPTAQSNDVNVPPELRETLNSAQLQLLSLITDLQERPNDSDTLLQTANLLYEFANYARAATYYERYVTQRPDDLSARTDLAASYFYAGRTDQAIQTVTSVLQENPAHVQANFNLGIMYWQGRRDYPAARTQFERVVELTANSADPQLQQVGQSAQENIAAIDAEAATAGSTGATSSAGGTQ